MNEREEEQRPRTLPRIRFERPPAPPAGTPEHPSGLRSAPPPAVPPTSPRQPSPARPLPAQPPASPFASQPSPARPLPAQPPASPFASQPSPAPAPSSAPLPAHPAPTQPPASPFASQSSPAPAPSSAPLPAHPAPAQPASVRLSPALPRPVSGAASGELAPDGAAPGSAPSPAGTSPSPGPLSRPTGSGPLTAGGAGPVRPSPTAPPPPSSGSRPVVASPVVAPATPAAPPSVARPVAPPPVPGAHLDEPLLDSAIPYAAAVPFRSPRPVPSRPAPEVAPVQRQAGSRHLDEPLLDAAIPYGMPIGPTPAADPFPPSVAPPPLASNAAPSPFSGDLVRPIEAELARRSAVDLREPVAPTPVVPVPADGVDPFAAVLSGENELLPIERWRRRARPSRRQAHRIRRLPVDTGALVAVPVLLVAVVVFAGLRSGLVSRAPALENSPAPAAATPAPTDTPPSSEPSLAAPEPVDAAFVDSVVGGGKAATYAFAPLPDGFPGKRVGDTLVPQPTYGTYVLRAYVERYADTPDESLRSGLRAFALVAIGRMVERGDALVFPYDPALNFGAADAATYSALTQAYYAELLARAAAITGDPAIGDAADRAYRALLIPIEQGGVLVKADGESVIAESPGEPGNITLTPWLSTLLAVSRYAEARDSEEARVFLRASSLSVAHLLPAFDDRGLRVSRIGLSDSLRARLVFSDAAGVEIGMLAVRSPSGTSYPIGTAEGRRTQWIDPVALVDPAASSLTLRGKEAGMRIFLTRLGFPSANAVTFEATAKTPTEVRLEVAVGSYMPTSSNPVAPRWRLAARSQLAPGSNTVALEIPWTLGELIAPPTDWSNTLEGAPANVIHASNIARLRELFTLTGIKTLETWADRWTDYVCLWPAIPRYEGLRVGEGGRAIDAAAWCSAAGGTPAVPAPTASPAP